MVRRRRSALMPTARLAASGPGAGYRATWYPLPPQFRPPVDIQTPCTSHTHVMRTLRLAPLGAAAPVASRPSRWPQRWPRDLGRPETSTVQVGGWLGQLRPYFRFRGSPELTTSPLATT